MAWIRMTGGKRAVTALKVLVNKLFESGYSLSNTYHETYSNISYSPSNGISCGNTSNVNSHFAGAINASFDVTNYKTLNIKTTGNKVIKFGLHTTKPTTHQPAYSKSKFVNNGEATLDISELTGNYYIVFSDGDTNVGSCSITDLTFGK